MAELAVAIEEFKKDIENRNSNSLKKLKSVKNKVSVTHQQSQQSDLMPQKS